MAMKRRTGMKPEQARREFAQEYLEFHNIPKPEPVNLPLQQRDTPAEARARKFHEQQTEFHGYGKPKPKKMPRRPLIRK